MKFVRYQSNTTPGPPRVGVLRDGEVRGAHEDVTMTSLLQGSPSDLVTFGKEIWDSTHVEVLPVDEVSFAIPVDRPAHIRDCLSFLDHARNARRARGVSTELEPEWTEMAPFYFSNVVDLFDASAPVRRPTGCQAFDYEVEMAAVVCGGGRDVSAAEARSVIAGYVLFCDWSARDFQAKERVMRIGQGKSKDMGSTLGPVLVSADELDELATHDGFRLQASVHINDDKISQGSFTGMNWSYEQLVEHVARDSTLVPGDLIAAGTIPLGCLLEHSGDESFRGWLEPGDTLVIDAGLLGVVRAPIVGDD